MKKKLLTVVILLAAILLLARMRYGGRGSEFPDRTSAPVLSADSLEVVATLDEPPGNIAVSAEGRIFISVHPESRPDTNKVVELVDGKPVPYPDAASQKSLFQTPLGVRIDRQGRLWTLDHGFHGLRQARLLAFDLKTGQVAVRYDFPSEVAEIGSFFNDMVVDPEGKHVYIADTSVLRKNPALVVYDVERRNARRLLESHPSMIEQNWVIRAPGREMVFFGGLFVLRPAVDSIALDANGEWLYYGPMSHEELFRVRAVDLNNESLSASALVARAEPYAPKPQSDGLSMDHDGNVYITDAEHRAILSLGKDRKLKTLIKDGRIRWPDGLSFGPGNWLYITDSAIPEIMLRSKDHIRSQAPYFVFRFKPGPAGTPGQ